MQSLHVIRRARLISGLILFAYVLTHLINHMAGLVSLTAMQDVLILQGFIWNGLVGLFLLYGAFSVHAGLAVWALYARRDFRMRPGETWQLLLGLAIPPLLVLHIAGTRGIETFLGAEVGYPPILLIYFELSQMSGLRQLLVTLIVWMHGCLGLYLWLRFKPWFPRWRSWLFAAALLVPTLSLTGTWMAGQWAQYRYEQREPPFTEALVSQIADPRKGAFIGSVERNVWLGYGALLLVALAARRARRFLEHRRGVVILTYPDGRRVRVPQGTTILEASRSAGIPHAALCGGRGRCSTCRVRIGFGLSSLPPADSAEAKVLHRVGAAPTVRLACQTRPTDDLEVQPLLPPNVTTREARARPGYLQGEEREIVVLFADLRGFTRLSESRLPFDVVFLLNRYFRTTGEAVERAGGRVDKFIGDGVMALFGVGPALSDDGRQAARNALQAAQLMAEGLQEVERVLAGDQPEPLRIGIGIHIGPAIVGEMGWGEAVSLTAVGDTVNTASRLEQATKDFGAQLVISAALAERAGVPQAGAERRHLELRGRSEPLEVLVFSDARQLQLAAVEA
ncbi:adenylate/guanylate cyclase domain-containing protein [Algihabitans albus]|uniref:adenylate/guanylate cyclase domain-containing protein n=1 Tax=Algihabitans albus TaxID=2164067 RepID=UPI000E5C677A|nr:adenylate/guanylate cyclase domain-containing protein [Algihabitans albus]